MATYTGLDKRIAYLFEHGGGGGGGGSFLCDLLYENTSFTGESGTASVERTYTLSASIDDYDAILVLGWTYNQQTDGIDNRTGVQTTFIPKADYYTQGTLAPTQGFLQDGSNPSVDRRLFFRFENNTTIKTLAVRNAAYVEPILYKVYGLKLGGSGHTYSTTEQVVGKWIDGKPLYEKTFDVGYLLNNGTKSISHNIQNLKNVISVIGGGKTDSGLMFPIIYTHPDGVNTGIGVIVNSTNIDFITKADRTTWHVYVTLRYTKTTD